MKIYSLALDPTWHMANIAKAQTFGGEPDTLAGRMPATLPLAETTVLTLQVGETALVEAIGLAMAGYLRHADTTDETVATVVRVKASLDTADIDLANMPIGGSPPDIFAITAVSPGTATIDIRCGRPWMQGREDDDAWSNRITVTVRGMPT